MKSASKGLTLIEILVVMLIISILASIAAPNFSLWLGKQAADSMMKQLQTAIALGKTSAVSSGGWVTLCRSSDGYHCIGKWHEGAIVFTDRNGDRKINEEDKLIRYFDFNSEMGTLSWNAFQNRQYLQLTPQGFTRFQNGNFTYCPHNKQAELARQLIINRTARARMALDKNGDGFREDANGQKIQCED